MPDRYFAETPITGQKVLLAGSEAHHLIHVMRAKPGTRVVLFDGSGAEFDAVVDRTRRADVELAILARHEVDREPPLEVILAVALPKGDRRKWLVEKVTELGVDLLVPLRTARAVAQPVQQAQKRLRRTVIEASKQCGRNRLMKIARPHDWTELVAETAAAPHRLLAHPHGEHKDAKPLLPPDSSDPVLLAVGPEGGFTAAEVSLAVAAGWQPIDLGPRTLRTETAAILLAAMVVQPPP